MKHFDFGEAHQLFLILGLILSAATASAQLNIHDVQYTLDPSGDSPYLDSTVTVQGVVTATEYSLPPLSLHSFFIADSGGGPWSGVLVATNSVWAINPGDWVEVSGQVQEKNEQTSIKNPEVTVLGTAPLPEATPVSAADFNQEQYEGVLVMLENVRVASEVSGGVWQVQDETGEASIATTWEYAYIPTVGDTLSQIKGIGVYISGTYRVEPRSDEDIGFAGNPRPVITNIEHFPTSPTEDDSVLVRCTVSDDDSLTRVELHFSVDGGASWDSLAMTREDSLYTGWIPPEPQGTTVKYFILAEDAEGAITQEPEQPQSYMVTAPLVTVPIDSIVNNFSLFVDQSVTIEGLITYIYDWTTSGGSQRVTGYIQDASGRALEISESGTLSSFPGLARGNFISLKGTVGEYQGAAQISDFSAVDINVLFPDWPISWVAPDTLLRTGDPNNSNLLDTDTEGVLAAGTWCRTKGYLTAVDAGQGGGTNLTFNDGSGPLIVRVWDDLDPGGALIGGEIVPFEDLINQVLEVSGAASEYSGTFQIEAGYAEDFKAEEPYIAASPRAAVWVEPHPFVPDLGETITIGFNAPAGAWIRLRLLNLKGQLVAMIRDQQSGGGYEIEWDGLDELKRRVSVGVYILQLQSTFDGKTTIASAPLVVGTRLK